MGGVAIDTVAQIVEVAQTVEIDIKLERAAKSLVDVKGKGKVPVGASQWKKRKTGGGASAGTQATLCGEGQPRKLRRDVECYH